MSSPGSSPAADAAGVVRGVIALECRIDPDTNARPALSHDDAGRLAQWLGRDLAALGDSIPELDLVVGAAHFDPAEALRPGWPLHRRLLEILQRAPGQGPGRIIGIGADAAGRVPRPLQADPDLRGGALRVLPWVLAGDADNVARTAAALEAHLFDRGMLGADAALMAQEALQLPIEHARCLTLHDLLAITAMQYTHQGLDSFWPLLESALLRPHSSTDLDAPPEPRARYASGKLHLVLPNLDDWRRRCIGQDRPEDQWDDARLRHGHAMYIMRARQFAAIADAHGLEVVLDTDAA